MEYDTLDKTTQEREGSLGKSRNRNSPLSYMLIHTTQSLKVTLMTDYNNKVSWTELAWKMN